METNKSISIDEMNKMTRKQNELSTDSNKYLNIE